MNSQVGTQILGRFTIKDAVTGEVLVDTTNAVHPQNMARVIARALARDDNGYIFKMCFGNGGTFLNSSDELVFRPPNTTGDADLYNNTYEIQVDEQSAGTAEANSVISSAAPLPSVSSVTTVTCLLGAGDPPGQAVADNIEVDPDSTYTFDELGLKSEDDLLLTHAVFSPIEKTANRAFLISYSVTINVA